MKSIPLSFLLFLFVSVLSAQTPEDSVRIVSIEWEEKTVEEGIVWKSAQVDLYDSPQSIHIVEISPASGRRLSIAYCVDTLIRTSILSEQNGAIAGVNASFFDMKYGGSVDYMRVDGKTIHQGREISRNRNAAVIVNKRKVSMVKLDTSFHDWPKVKGKNILVAGPMLIESFVMEDLPEIAFNVTRHPRTGIAQTASGTIILIAVDGRHPGKAAGMSTKELAYLLKVLGAEEAMNLDGGGSTAMYIRGYGETGIVNYPSDNKVFDRKGERKVANAIIIK